MQTTVNDNGVWKAPLKTSVNDNGTWKEVQRTYVNDNGTWKTVQTAIKISCLDWLNSGSTTDGVYTINPTGGEVFDVYCDMTTDGGGWTLLLTGRGDDVSHMGWNRTNIYERNKATPSMVETYSIIGKGDDIKKSASGWQYMMEASLDSTTRHTFGGIFTANQAYSISSISNTQTDVTANQWFPGVTGFVPNSGISQIVPHIGDVSTSSVANIVYTTDNGPTSWWGTLIQTDAAYGNYHIGPWLSSTMPQPNWTRMWIR